MVNGFGYTGQTTTYGAWLSDHWRFIALDTAYLCYKTNENGDRNAVTGETEAPNPDAVISWLKDTVLLGHEDDKRGIVLFSHHDPFSDFSKAYLATAQQLSSILPPNRKVVWFYGHDHELSFYSDMQLSGTNFITIPRMVGNGGFADKISPPARSNSLLAWDSRVYQEIPTVPPAKAKVGFNGYFKILVEGPELRVSYISGKCKDDSCLTGLSETESTLVAEETFTVDLDSGDIAQKWNFMLDTIERPGFTAHAMAGATAGHVIVEDSLPFNESQGTLWNLQYSTTD